MHTRSHKAIKAIALSLIFYLGQGLPARGQLIEVGKARRRRVGRVVLPTPPFNPDAGILDSPKGHSRNAPKTGPRRPMSRHTHSSRNRRRVLRRHRTRG